jgi:uncharacterized protein (TIGR04222 family)
MTPTQLPPEVQAMWEKLEGFQLDDTNAVFDFSARLAKENGWTRSYTQRVIQEYKRFLLMAMHAGHPVTPSEAVDQAWHLHLVYTRSYWEKLRRDILGRPLHHEPTAGGRGESAKFRAQYQQTLNSYRRLFGDPAPADVWPSVDDCFKPKTSRWVDAFSYWLVPKPEWIKHLTPRLLKTAAAAIFSILVLASCHASWNVFDLQGSEFVRIYLVSYPTALAISLLWVKLARGRPLEREKPLTDPYQIAFLAGGGGRVVDAALAVLFGLKLFRIDESLGWLGQSQGTTRIKRDDRIAPPANLHDLELRVLNAMPSSTSVEIVELRTRLAPAMEVLQEQLTQEALISTSAERSRLRKFAALPLVTIMAIGAGKAVLGLSQDKPVGALLFLLVLSFLFFIARMANIRRRTATGEAVLRLLQNNHATETGRSQALDDPMGAALRVALDGHAALRMLGYSALHFAIMRPDAASGCGAGGSGYDGHCEGGGCGGCRASS